MSSFKELNISNPGTSTKYGGDDTDLINKLFNGTVAGIPPVTIKSQNKFGFWDNILWVENQAASRRTTIRGQSNVPSTNVDLALPPITGNDTLAAIGLQNIWSAKQEMDSGLLYKEMSTPSNPSATFHHMYVDIADGHLKKKKYDGTIRDYDSATSLTSALFTDQALQYQSPTGGYLLTVRSPQLTAHKDYRFYLPFTYLIEKEGSTYYVKNGMTGAIETSNAEPGPVFQWAIDNAAGGKIFVCAGTYTFNALGNPAQTNWVLSIPSNTWIEGETMFSTKLVLGATMASTNFIENTNPTTGNVNIVLQHLYVDATISNNKNTIAFTRVQNLKILYCYVKNGVNSHFNCFITGGRDAGGLPNYYVINSQIHGCIFESDLSCDWDNFTGGLITNSAISDCTFINSGGSAGMAQRLMTDTTVTNCVAYNSASSGFSMEAGHGCSFANCIAHDCSTSGFKALHIDSGGPPVDGFPLNLQYSNCRAYNCGKGFEFEGQFHVFTACYAYNNSIMGFRIYNDYNLLTGCFAFNNGTDTGQADTNRCGIKLDYIAHTGYTYVGKNIVQNCYVFDNQGTPTQKYGIRELSTTVNNNFIEGNKVWGSGLADISKQGAATNTAGNWTWNGTAWVTIESSVTGEANTASNVGTAGVGIFKQKSAVDLQFKKINAGSSRITITDDTGNSEVDVDLATTLAGMTLTTPVINGVKFADVGKVNTDSPFTATATNKAIRVDCTSGNFTLNLPAAATAGAGTVYTIIRTDVIDSSNILTITPNGSETIGSCVNWKLMTAERVEIESDGSNWKIVSNTYPNSLGYYFLKGSTPDRTYVGGISYQAATIFTNSTTAPALNTLWALPIVISRITKFDVVRFLVSTLASAGGVARAGIYRDNGAVYPGALIFDTGSIAVDAGSTSASRDTTITSGLQIFQPGLYWLAWECGTAAPQIRTLSTANGLLSIIGSSNVFATGSIAGFGYSVAHTFGALPDPYTTSATILTATPGATAPVPAIGLRPI